MNLNQDDQFSVVLTQNHDAPYGFRVELSVMGHGVQSYQNVTMFRWYTQEGGSLTPRVICNSSIHMTGIGWDAKDVYSAFISIETAEQIQF